MLQQIANFRFGVFQFTPLREGRPTGYNGEFGLAIFQFTPLREGRPAFAITVSSTLPISIHAPT